MLLIWVKLGCEIFNFEVRFALFVAETEQGVALAILRGVIDFKREPWPQISDSAKSLVRQMLEPDPKKRLTAEQVLGKLFSVCTRVQNICRVTMRQSRLDFKISETLLF